MAQTADAVVIGAGVNGASIAFHLARRGLRPEVLDRSTIASGATGQSSGKRDQAEGSLREGWGKAKDAARDLSNRDR